MRYARQLVSLDHIRAAPRVRGAALNRPDQWLEYVTRGSQDDRRAQANRPWSGIRNS